MGANGADVEVGIADPTSSCASWIQSLAGTGLVWYPITTMLPPGSQAGDGDTMGVSCDLTDGTQELYVVDGGGEFYGNSICSQEEQNGWTPEGSPGPLAAQGQQQEQAAAAASAAASRASANAAAEQQAQNDLGTLEGFSLASDLSALSGDVQQTDDDLGTVKSDAANGQGSYCGNVSTAGADADAVAADADALSADLDAMTNDITTSAPISRTSRPCRTTSPPCSPTGCRPHRGPQPPSPPHSRRSAKRSRPPTRTSGLSTAT
jgi:hypothetical protein